MTNIAIQLIVGLIFALTALAPKDSTTVVLLGTGTPFPDQGRQGPATAVVYGKRVFLFDAGSGVERQLHAAGLPIDGPEATFVTHLHSDHTLGLPDLILTSWVMHRNKPLQLYGPIGLQHMVDHIMAAYSEDINVRTNGLEREWRGGQRVHVHEIKSGVVYDSGGVRITAFKVPHGSWRYAYGYRVDTPDRSIVIAGDTRKSDAVIKYARNVDVLVHEFYYESTVHKEDRAGGEFWPQYVKAFHTSDTELGEVAAGANPKLLLLTHVMWWGDRNDSLFNANVRRAGYKGIVMFGKDLGRY